MHRNRNLVLSVTGVLGEIVLKQCLISMIFPYIDGIWYKQLNYYQIANEKLRKFNKPMSYDKPLFSFIWFISFDLIELGDGV